MWMELLIRNKSIHYDAELIRCIRMTSQEDEEIDTFGTLEKECTGFR